MEFCQFAAKFYTAMDNITSRSVAAVKDGSTRKPLRQVFLLAALFPLLLSCDGIFPYGQGTLRVKLSSESGISSGSKSQTSLSPVPDTEDFILSITDSNGKSIYNGRFGDSPESYELKAGNYTVAAASLEFDSPAFDEPCFSDSRMIMLKDGQELFVELNCIQSNCGIVLESNDINSIYNGILSVMNMDSEKYRLYCTNALKAAENFDYKVHAGELEKIFNGVMEERKNEAERFTG